MTRITDDREFENRWRARFEHFGAVYRDEALVAGWSANGLATRLRRFTGLVGAVQGDWLDVGCGAGTYVRRLRDLGANHVCGVDYSVPSLSLAADLAGGNSWVAADGRRLPFDDHCWDGVICFGVTQALADSSDLLHELIRVVAPGGRVWVDGLNGGGIPRAVERLLRRSSRVRYERPSRLARLLRRSGCRDVRIHWVLILPGRLGGWQRALERLGCQRWPVLGRLLGHAFIVSARKGESSQGRSGNTC